VAAHRRWATGVYAVWYPMMDPGAMRRFERDVTECGVRRVLCVELSVQPQVGHEGLRGCGMLVVNPPFGLVDECGAWLEWLWRVLSRDGAGGWRAQWLVPE
jgi:23S rRNA (adenine2030-N6)-methyltransferase